MRVRLAFSMVNFVLPSCPAIRPGAGLRWGLQCEDADELTDGTRQVITMQSFDVLDLERIEVQVVQAEECNRVLIKRETLVTYIMRMAGDSRSRRSPARTPLRSLHPSE